MTTHDFSTSTETITFTFGTVTEKHFSAGHEYTNTFNCFDYSAGRGDFEPSHKIILDAKNDSQTNDKLIEQAINA